MDKLSLVGRVFSKLRVVSEAPVVNKRTMWNCVCDCGNEVTVIGSNLTAGNTISCGCHRSWKGRKRPKRVKISSSYRLVDRTNEVYGYLTVKQFSHRENRKVYWICECVCGDVKPYPTSMLRLGKSKPSCGCKHKYTAFEFEITDKASFYAVYRTYKKGASRRKVPFELSKQSFREITQQDCFYCGVPPYRSRTHPRGYTKPFTYNGLDRVDNNKGYTKDNVVPCCTQCNRMKMHSTLEDFYESIKRIYHHKNLGGDAVSE